MAAPAPAMKTLSGCPRRASPALDTRLHDLRRRRAHCLCASSWARPAASNLARGSIARAWNVAPPPGRGLAVPRPPFRSLDSVVAERLPLFGGQRYWAAAAVRPPARPSAGQTRLVTHGTGLQLWCFLSEIDIRGEWRPRGFVGKPSYYLKPQVPHL